MRFKNHEESPKRTIFASSELVLLQLVSESDTERVPVRTLSPKGGWTQGGVPARMLGPKREVD